MPYALPLDHRGDSLGVGGGTGGTINATGADLLIIAVGYYDAGHVISPVVPGELTDTLGNTYLPLTNYTTDNHEAATRMFYCQGGAAGTVAVVVNTGGASVYVAACIAAFSGSLASPFDVENGAGSTGAVTSIQPGSLTPSLAGCLIVSSLGWGGTGTLVCGTGTLLDQVALVSSTSYGVGLAYQIQTTATAINPAWSGFNYRAASAIASFKAASGGGGGGAADLSVMLQEPIIGSSLF